VQPTKIAIRRCSNRPLLRAWYTHRMSADDIRPRVRSIPVI